MIRPISDRIVVRRAEISEKVGLIFIPEIAKEPPQQGTVLAVGPGLKDVNGARIPMDVQLGETVLFGRFSGVDIEVDGEPVVVLREPEIIGRVQA